MDDFVDPNSDAVRALYLDPDAPQPSDDEAASGEFLVLSVLPLWQLI